MVESYQESSLQCNINTVQEVPLKRKPKSKHLFPFYLNIEKFTNRLIGKLKMPLVKGRCTADRVLKWVLKYRKQNVLLYRNTFKHLKKIINKKINHSAVLPNDDKLDYPLLRFILGESRHSKYTEPFCCNTILPFTISDLSIPGFSNLDAVSCYANASLQVIFNCTRILNILINSLEDTVLKKLAYSYTSQVCQLSAFSIRNQIGHPYVNIEQQDAAEFISALISLYEPLHNSLLHQHQTILKCSRCKKNRVHISNNYIIQLNVPNDTKTVTMHSMLNDMSKEVTIENITCSACNTTSNHTQTTNILNTHEYLYFQIQLWSDVNTKITNLQINSLPNTTLTVDSKCYTLNSVICHHGQSMTEAHYTAIIKHQNKWVRCNDTFVQFERWPRGAKDVYIIIMEKK